MEINLIGPFSCLVDEGMENGKVRVQRKRERGKITCPKRNVVDLKYYRLSFLELLLFSGKKYLLFHRAKIINIILKN